MCSTSISYLDAKISSAIANSQASYSEYEKAIKLCVRQQKLIQLFSERGWKLPIISNREPEKCRDELEKRQESGSLSNRISEEDRKIDELFRQAQSNLSVETCDTLIALLKVFEEDLAVCKKKRVKLPDLINQDTKKAAKRAADLRTTASQKEALHQRISRNDLQIENILRLTRTTPEQWQELLSLCHNQELLISECTKNGWPLPEMRYSRPADIANMYKHYLTMADVDKKLSAERENLSSQKQYKQFFSDCEWQKSNIDVCNKNGWAIPPLVNADPAGLSNEVHAEKSKKDRKKRTNRKLTIFAVGVVVVAALVLFGIVKYRQGKVQIPFDSSYVVGKTLDSVYKELDDAGFENIQKIPNTSDWREGNSVISVTIDNKDSYSKDTYQKPDVTVVINYSSTDRIYATDLLKNWKTTAYTDIEKTLRDAGFTNVTTKEVITDNKDQDGLTADLSLNGKNYTNEHCYLPKNAPIVVSYYVLKIGIGNSNAQFIGQDYEKVVASLQESGFTNVETQIVTTGLAKGNTVVGVTVNYSESYNSNTAFDPDVKIVVKYSSDDRIDATKTIENWQTKEYTVLQAALTGKGFIHITVVEKVTTDLSKNHLVASIALNNETYTAGDCFLQKTAPIKIEYYATKRAIGAPSDFKGEQYREIVSELESNGFTNIHLLRGNDLVTGWVNKEGTIDSITVNGRTEFTKSDSFYCDTPIVIVVHTFKNKGCEDITEIAD